MQNHIQRSSLVPYFIMLTTCIMTFASLGNAKAAYPNIEPGAQEKSAENILIYWNDGSRLKAVTLMSVAPHQKNLGIVAIPIYTRLEKGAQCDTLEELYAHRGRKELIRYLESNFRSPINKYVGIHQEALIQASSVVGPINMDNKKTTLLEVFEGTYTDQAIDIQEEIRAVAANLIEPSVLMKVPHLIWIFKNHVETNLGLGTVLSLYRAVQGHGPEILTKAALPGKDYFVGTRKYREVSPGAWLKVLHDVKKSVSLNVDLCSHYATSTQGILSTTCLFRISLPFQDPRRRC